MPSEIEDAPLIAGDNESQVITNSVRWLPPHAVKDLLSVGVCLRCILRLSGIRGHAYSCLSFSPSILLSVLEEPKGSGEPVVDDASKVNEDLNDLLSFQESGTEPLFCSICLGILQFAYSEEKETWVRKDCAKDFAVSIANLVKKEDHQIDSFSLEVSIPQIIMANERAIWLFMKKKYGSEVWFQEKFFAGLTSLKDALKLAITSSLESLLAVRSAVSSPFHIRLTYTHSKASIVLQNFVEKDQGFKRRKTGTEDSFDSIDGSVPLGMECSEKFNREADVVILKSLNSLQEPSTLPEKVNQPCHLATLCYRMPIYIGGRYLKYSRNVSQTRWIIDDERMGEASVEELIGSNILPICRGDNYKFHAAGREDIDVRMLGSGRPFLIEVQNARCVPSRVSTKEMEDKINNLENKLIGIKNLMVVDSQVWTLMREGEAEKQKQYTAVVWISRPLEDKDLEAISSAKDMHILQRTPIRVLHRRSPLEREKIIHWMRIERIAESSQYFLLHLCTQAGTYIKEFVHGDLGRTHPCMSSMLGCRAEILQLDVTDVKMDCFLSE